MPPDTKYDEEKSMDGQKRNGTVSHTEWEKAKQILTNQKDGTKLRRKEHGLAHSFIKLGGKIYAFGNFLGYGSSGVAKLVMDEEGNRFVLKIRKETSKQGGSHSHYQGGGKEVDRLKRVSEATGKEILIERCLIGKKHYILMHYFGKSGVPPDARTGGKGTWDGKQPDWKAKINLLLFLEKLHSAEIFHRDIRPENIAMDEKGELHFIDYDSGGSGNNMYEVHPSEPPEQNDLFAIMRTIGYPDHIEKKYREFNRQREYRRYSVSTLCCQLILEDIKQEIKKITGPEANRLRLIIESISSLIYDENNVDDKKNAIAKLILDTYRTCQQEPSRFLDNILIKNNELNALWTQIEDLDEYSKRFPAAHEKIGAVNDIKQSFIKIASCYVITGKYPEMNTPPFPDIKQKIEDSIQILQRKRSTTIPILSSFFASLTGIGLIVGLVQYYLLTDRKQFLFFKNTADSFDKAQKIKETLEKKRFSP